LAIIFDGKGNISQQERDLYASDVEVFFQESAWADTDFFLEWIRRVYFKHIDLRNEQLLFLDGLKAHVAEKCQRVLKDICNTYVLFSPPGRTDLVQPVDAGAGKDIIKGTLNIS